MSKTPAFQFYPGDWTRDLDDQPLEIEGAWIRICCRLHWAETYGQATKTLGEWSRILRKTEKKTREIFQILIEKHIADGSCLDNQNVTIISRRMVKDDKIRQIRREVGKLGGNPSLIYTSENLDNQTSNQKPTPSSSSSSSLNKEKEYSMDFLEFWKVYPKKNSSKKQAFKDWKATTKPSLEIILSALQAQLAYKQTLRKSGAFCPEWPDAERWIKKARWEDEIPEVKNVSTW